MSQVGGEGRPHVGDRSSLGGRKAQAPKAHAPEPGAGSGGGAALPAPLPPEEPELPKEPPPFAGGFFARRRARRQWLKARQALARWTDEDRELRDLVQIARTFEGITEDPSTSIVLKRGERIFQTIEGAGLVEPKREPGHWVGGYSGFSFRIAKGVRYHVGGTRGTYVQGDEKPTIVDRGSVTLTNQRVVFQGSTHAREWAFSRLIGYQHRDGWTALQVSNRQKVSGIAYGAEAALHVQFSLALALAHFRGDVEGFVGELERELSQHQSLRPLLPEPGASR